MSKHDSSVGSESQVCDISIEDSREELPVLNSKCNATEWRDKKEIFHSWNYFLQSQCGTLAQCKQCDCEVSTNGSSTSSLQRHLKKKHRNKTALFVKSDYNLQNVYKRKYCSTRKAKVNCDESNSIFDIQTTLQSQYPAHFTSRFILNYVVRGCNFWTNSIPSLIDHLHRYDVQEVIVDVACTYGKNYEGDAERRLSTQMRFGEFFELMNASNNAELNEVSSEKRQLSYYLAQCPIISNEDGKSAAVPGLAPCFRTHPLFPNSDVLQVCLWAGPTETSTNLHYDCNHNLLLVLRGSKVVTLLPPSVTPILCPLAVYTTTPNHSTLSSDQITSILLDGIAKKDGSVRVKLETGHALYIPEGWWHQVDSEKCTIALNIWYKGPRSKLINPTSQPFYLRCLVRELLESARQQEKTQRRKKFKLSDLNSCMNTVNIFSIPREQRGLYLSSLTPITMELAIKDAVEKDLNKWLETLCELSPEHAKVVTEIWEEIGDRQGESGTFFESLTLDEYTRKKLLRLTAESSREMCMSMLEKILGPLQADV